MVSTVCKYKCACMCVCVCVCIYIYVYIYEYLPTSPLRQNVTKGQFLSGV